MGKEKEMILDKKTLNSTPPLEKEVLMLIDVEDKDYYVWVVGVWTEKGWCCPFDNVGYTVVEWYELPVKYKVKKDYYYHQMRMEEFWGDK